MLRDTAEVAGVPAQQFGAPEFPRELRFTISQSRRHPRVTIALLMMVQAVRATPGGGETGPGRSRSNFRANECCAIQSGADGLRDRDEHPRGSDFMPLHQPLNLLSGQHHRLAPHLVSIQAVMRTFTCSPPEEVSNARATSASGNSAVMKSSARTAPAWMIAIASA